MALAGYRSRIFAQAVRARWGDVCWLCGHGGARQVDHLISQTERPDLIWDVSNCRPAHGAPGNPCPVCTRLAGRKIHCNQLRGWGSPERARRLITELTGGQSPPVTGKARPPAVRPETGREW